MKKSEKALAVKLSEANDINYVLIPRLNPKVNGLADLTKRFEEINHLFNSLISQMELDGYLLTDEAEDLKFIIRDYSENLQEMPSCFDFVAFDTIDDFDNF